MPLLNSGFLANWYKMSLPNYDSQGNMTAGSYEVIVENYTESKVQEAQNKSMIQGDIGAHIMDIGTVYYTTSITSPVLINYTTECNDIFDTIVYFTNIQRQPVNGTFGLAYLLKSARIEVTTDAVRATGNFEGDTAVASAAYNGVNQQIDLLARTARFYDTYFYFGEITDSAQYPVISGEININFDIDKNYFLGQMWNYGADQIVPSQSPFFSIRSYSATGNIKIGLSPAQYVFLTELYAGQAPGLLKGNTGNIGVFIANNGGAKNLKLGTAFVITKIEFSMQQNSIITATLEFNAFFNNAIGDLRSFSLNA